MRAKSKATNKSRQLNQTPKEGAVAALACLEFANKFKTARWRSIGEVHSPGTRATSRCTTIEDEKHVVEIPKVLIDCYSNPVTMVVFVER